MRNKNSLSRDSESGGLGTEALGFIAARFSCDGLINSIRVGLSGLHSRPAPRRKAHNGRELLDSRSDGWEPGLSSCGGRRYRRLLSPFDLSNASCDSRERLLDSEGWRWGACGRRYVSPATRGSSQVGPRRARVVRVTFGRPAPVRSDDSESPAELWPLASRVVDHS